jgi:hypothetical protein
MMNETQLEREFRASTEREAQLNLAAWHDVAKWLDYAAAEFVADVTTRCHLEHVGQCVREEGERRYAKPAGLALV